jgi:hypothetical protein
MNLALVTFAVEKMISFSAKVHGQSFIRIAGIGFLFCPASGRYRRKS